MSATQTPPPGPSESGPPPAAPERHCRRCGAALAPGQEWCLACGAATRTEVARPRGWRVPLLLAGAIVALAVAAAVLAIVELSRGPDRVAQATPTPGAATPVPTTITPVPTAPGAPENEGGANPTVTPAPGATASPSPSPTVASSSSIASWPAGRSAWTIVLKSATSRSQAESTARSLQAQGVTVGLLDSSAHSSLRPGYWVVFSGQYDSRAAAESALSALPSKPADAYVRKVSAS